MASKRSFEEVCLEDTETPKERKKLTGEKDWYYSKEEASEVFKYYYGVAIINMFDQQCSSMFNHMKKKYGKETFSNTLELSYALRDMVTDFENQFKTDKLAEKAISEIKEEIEDAIFHFIDNGEGDQADDDLSYASLRVLDGSDLDDIHKNILDLNDAKKRLMY